MASLLYMSRDGAENYEVNDMYWAPFEFFFFAQGLMFLLVRFTETEFYKAIWCTLRNFFASNSCCNCHQNAKDESKTNLDTSIIRSSDNSEADNLNSVKKANR